MTQKILVMHINILYMKAVFTKGIGGHLEKHLHLCLLSRLKSLYLYLYHFCFEPFSKMLTDLKRSGIYFISRLYAEKSKDVL